MKLPSTSELGWRRQSGAVLITVLIFLTVLTILGLASSQSTTIQEHIVGNFRNRQLALEAAEAGLRDGEGLLANNTTFDAMAWNGSDGTFEGDPSLDPLAYQTGTNNYLKAVSLSTVTADLESVPVYYIERLAQFDLPMSSLVVGFQRETPTIRFYRVTARGTGLTGRSTVILQSSYYR